MAAYGAGSEIMTQDERNALHHYRFGLLDVVAEKDTVPVAPASWTLDELSSWMEANEHSSFLVVTDEDGNYVDGVSVFDVMAKARIGRQLVTDVLEAESEHNAELAETYGTMLVGDLVGTYSLSGTNPDWRTEPTAQTRSVFHEFVAGLHYRLVCEHGMETQGKVVTKMDVVKWTLANQDKVLSEELLDSSVVKLGLLYRNPDTLVASTPAGIAFEEMYQEKCDGFAIVDDDGNLLGNFSVSDVKGLTSANFGDLQLPVLDYLRMRGRKRVPVTCTVDTTLAELLSKFVDNGCSRVWCVDKGVLVGLCGMTQIMGFFNRI